MDQVGIELTTYRLKQRRQLPMVQHVRFVPQIFYRKYHPNGMAEAALENWKPVWNAHVLISIPEGPNSIVFGEIVIKRVGINGNNIMYIFFPFVFDNIPFGSFVKSKLQLVMARCGCLLNECLPSCLHEYDAFDPQSKWTHLSGDATVT